MNFSYSLSVIDQAAHWLLDQVGSAKVICFHGEMGAGKTTLIQAICRQLGVKTMVSSPTFPIINAYGIGKGDDSVYHMDLYRLEDVEEAERAGVVDALYGGSVCLVEWPAKLPSIIPRDAVHVKIQLEEGEQRRLELLNK